MAFTYIFLGLSRLRFCSDWLISFSWILTLNCFVCCILQVIWNLKQEKSFMWWFDIWTHGHIKTDVFPLRTLKKWKCDKTSCLSFTGKRLRVHTRLSVLVIIKMLSILGALKPGAKYLSRRNSLVYNSDLMSSKCCSHASKIMSVFVMWCCGDHLCWRHSNKCLCFLLKKELIKICNNKSYNLLNNLIIQKKLHQMIQTSACSKKPRVGAAWCRNLATHP